MKKFVSLLLTVALLATMFTVFSLPASAVDSEVSIEGVSLVLSDGIGLAFRVYVPQKYRSGVMVLEFMDDKPIVVNIADCPHGNDKRYTVTYYLNAIELSEQVTLYVYAEYDDEHSSPLARASCSVEECVALLKDDEKAPEQEKVVAEALMKYGYYAQLACSDTNGWTIGKDYAETIHPVDELGCDVSVFKSYGIDWAKHPETPLNFSVSLQLDYKTGIHLYFPLDEKPTVVVNSEAVEVTDSDRLENTYEVFIEGINLLNLEDKYEITVNTATFMLSAFSCCNSMISDNADENTVNALRALYELYYKANELIERSSSFADKGLAVKKSGNKEAETVIVPAEDCIAEGSAISDGNILIIIAVAVVVLGTVAAIIIIKKKKKPAEAVKK